MEKPHGYDPDSYLGTFFAVDKTPEGILLRTVIATAAVLTGAALFFHNPVPLIPGVVLLAVLHRYHKKRNRAETGSAARSGLSDGSPAH